MGSSVSYSWFQETFRVLPDDADEETIMIYTRAYIMMLFGTQLFGDKSGAYVGHRVGRWCSRQDHLSYFSLGYFGSSRLFDLTSLMTSDGHLHLASDQKCLRLLQLRQAMICYERPIALDVVGVVDLAILDEKHTRFGGVQSRPPKALDLDFLHSKDGSSRDRWFPGDYLTCIV
ncbi:hypothetical protein PIB30_094090 [Stylosanthes scabra]|uniref:Uncharacterized protein n=1 Tax=Stylosanthes scabra TaxID=79078 RepID=A0ABU6TXK3_9FABA|nr:hypothetical protein [Stylosanthes scabra]